MGAYSNNFWGVCTSPQSQMVASAHPFGTGQGTRWFGNNGSWQAFVKSWKCVMFGCGSSTLETASTLFIMWGHSISPVSQICTFSIPLVLAECKYGCFATCDFYDVCSVHETVFTHKNPNPFSPEMKIMRNTPQTKVHLFQLRILFRLVLNII